MIILDTHAWIWFADESKHLSKRARQAIKRSPVLGVSAITVWETAMLAVRGRLRFKHHDVKSWIREALALERVELLPLTPNVAMRAASLGSAIHNDPVDRIIVATALEHDVPIVTKDGPITAAGIVRCIW